jgi:hypothetical protein
MTDKTHTTIEMLTASLAEYVRIYQELDDGGLTDALKEHESIKPMPWFPKYVETKACDSISSIRAAIECGEPETVADVLSLAVLARDRIEDEFPHYESRDADQRKISAMLTAIIRGLDRLSPGHPLVTTRYFISDRCLKSDEDEITMLRTAMQSITNAGLA